MRKYYIFIAVLGITTLTVLIGGFLLVGSPVSEQSVKLDQQRMSDFYTIKYQIEYYYRNNNRLPTDLRILPTNIKLSDPKTGKAYDFVPVTETQYKLCTEFATNTRNDIVSEYSTTHLKGYDCITYTIASNIYKPTPTLRPFRSLTPPVTSFCSPGDSASVCNPVGEWKMDENTGSGTDAVKDTSGNGNHGDMTSNMTTEAWVPGKVGTGLDFDGSEDSVNAGDVNQIDGATAMTITVWAKWEATPGSLNLEREFARKDSVFALGAGWDSSREGKGRFWINDGAWFNSGDGITSLDDGNWHQIVGVYDGTYIKLYVDGILETSNYVGSKTLSSNANNLHIGSFNDTGEFWNGIIDEVRLYNYAWTPAQIAWEYNQGEPIGR